MREYCSRYSQQPEEEEDVQQPRKDCLVPPEDVAGLSAFLTLFSQASSCTCTLAHSAVRSAPSQQTVHISPSQLEAQSHIECCVNACCVVMLSAVCRVVLQNAQLQ